VAGGGGSGLRSVSTEAEEAPLLAAITKQGLLNRTV
jgi:hypothetical protein